VRKKKNDPRVVTYQIDRNVNYTNCWTEYCTFCAFYRPMGHQEGYLLTDEDIFKKIEEMVALGGTGVLLQGGLNPELKIDYYETLLRSIRQRFPRVHLHCFSAPEVLCIAEVNGLSLRDTILRLRDAGLDSIPGGGAEILDDEVRQRIARLKCTSDEWCEVHRTAHALGIPTHCTMLYGHVETNEERVDHLLRLRELQDETGGFLAFIPLAFHPENTVFERRGWRHTTGADDLKMIAVARLLLDNIPHVKAYWIMMGLPLAQVALHFGANDVQGTVVREEIFHRAGARTETEQKIEQLVRFVKEAGRTPVQRDTLYNELRRWE